MKDLVHGAELLKKLQMHPIEVCASSDIWRNLVWDPCKYVVLDKTKLKGLWGWEGHFYILYLYGNKDYFYEKDKIRKYFSHWLIVPWQYNCF